MIQKTHPAGLSIRQATVEDDQALAVLATQLGYPSTASQIQKRFAHIAADEEQVVLVARLADGELVGFTHVFTTMRLFCDPFAELGAMVVDKDQRGKGIGGELVRAAERWVVDRGISQMRIRSNTLRAGAKGFYLQLDYDVSKTQNVFIKQLK